MTQSGKGDNSVNYLEDILKVNHVIYTLDKICEPNIMILAQAVLEILCPQGSIGLQWERRKRAITLQQQV